MRLSLVASVLAALVLLAACGARDTVVAVEDVPAVHTFDPDDVWNLAAAPVLGPVDAPVTIVIFSDFQCPFCGRGAATLSGVLDDPAYAETVRLVFKHMPLSMHRDAEPAARASWAAQRQDAFWEYHDRLFAGETSALDRNSLLAHATALGLDMERFVADMDSPAATAAVAADVALAGRLGVTGTPHFAVNGRSVRGAQPAAAFQTAIDEELAEVLALREAGLDAGAAYAARLEANLGDSGRLYGATPTPSGARGPDPDDEMFVPVGESGSLGAPDALVTIVAFIDYQCPYCARAEATMATLLANYGDDLRVVYRHNPLAFHEQARPAAQASIAAQHQERFADMHRLLFANQSALTEGDLERYATELGLDLAQFRIDMASEDTDSRIAQDQALAERLLARGTPTFYVNGLQVRGAQPVDAFKERIDAALIEARELVAQGIPRDQVYETLQSDANTGAPRLLE
jgi:protein-disulfide isomerase